MHAYLFLRQISGTPPHWQKFMYEVVAMVRQFGIPSWFMTLSCADLRWPELFQIIARTQGKNMTEEQVGALLYNERCSMLNLRPIVVAKHVQHRVETNINTPATQPSKRVSIYMETHIHTSGYRVCCVNKPAIDACF